MLHVYGHGEGLGWGGADIPVPGTTFSRCYPSVVNILTVSLFSFILMKLLVQQHKQRITLILFLIEDEVDGRRLEGVHHHLPGRASSPGGTSRQCQLL